MASIAAILVKICSHWKHFYGCVCFVNRKKRDLANEICFKLFIILPNAAIKGVEDENYLKACCIFLLRVGHERVCLTAEAQAAFLRLGSGLVSLVQSWLADVRGACSQGTPRPSGLPVSSLHVVALGLSYSQSQLLSIIQVTLGCTLKQFINVSTVPR